jgi:hypothetical protein
MRRAALLALLALVVPRVGSAQIEEAVRGVDGGWIRFAFQARDGVEICPDGLRFGDSGWVWSRGRGRGAAGCAPGPVEVELEARGGVVRRVELVRLGRGSPRAARDIGEVEAAEAARYFLSLAERGASLRAARDALLPAFLADVPEIWRELARLAGDGSVASQVREGALFWLGQEAASEATAGIAAVASDEEEEQEVREAAVFALSQRPPSEGLPILMDLARSAEQAETRRAAFFWLAQVDDERVVGFFTEVLRQGSRE